MPRTPPIILPTNPSGSWFSNTNGKEKVSSYDKLDDLNNLSPLTYSPSDDEESAKSKNNIINKRSKKMYNNASEETLYHKPTSNQPSQQSTSHSNQQQYELVDEDEGEDQNSDNNSNQDNTQCEEDKFNFVIDDLKSEFQLYTEEYKEFKRHVDNAKRELLDFIQDRTVYFEERGSYLNQKWDSLRQLI